MLLLIILLLIFSLPLVQFIAPPNLAELFEMLLPEIIVKDIEPKSPAVKAGIQDGKQIPQ